MLPAISNWHCFLYLYVFILHWPVNALVLSIPNDAFHQRDISIATPLVDFQVSQPILTPAGTSDQYGCISTQTLMSHVFANSYGAPFVGRALFLQSPNIDVGRLILEQENTLHHRAALIESL